MSSTLRHRLRRLRRVIGPLDRIAQTNVALMLALVVIVRLSVEIQQSSGNEPDPLVLLGFLATCAAATVVTVLLYRGIRVLPLQRARILVAVGSVLLQAAAFQVLISIAT